MSKVTLKTSLTCRCRLIEGPLSAVIPLCFNDLRAPRYSERTIQIYQSSLAHFSQWMEAQGFDLSDFDSKLIERYLQLHWPADNCLPTGKARVRNRRAALRCLLGFVTRKHLLRLC